MSAVDVGRRSRPRRRKPRPGGAIPGRGDRRRLRNPIVHVSPSTGESRALRKHDDEAKS